MYPYILVVNEKGELFRHAKHLPIPKGYFKITRHCSCLMFKRFCGKNYSYHDKLYSVYDDDGELNPRYWTFNRTIESIGSIIWLIDDRGRIL